MLIGVLLALGWVLLLLRYPLRSLQIGGVALIPIIAMLAYTSWQEARQARQMEQLILEVTYDPGHCPADRPLWTRLSNRATVPLVSLQWQIQAYLPGREDINLSERRMPPALYSNPEGLQPGQSWEICRPLPELRSGYRPETLEFRAEDLQGAFRH